MKLLIYSTKKYKICENQLGGIIMKKQSGVATAAGREIFEAKSGIEAAMRAGKNPNLKGIVHETTSDY